MNLAHVHLLLNHFPTIGTIIAIGIFVLAVLLRSDDGKRGGLALFFLIAMLSVPAYLSGNAAQETLVGRPGVSEVLMEAHEDAAVFALLLVEITGVVAWLGLWQFRRISRVTPGVTVAVLLLSVLTTAAMTRTATLGGEIRHEEIRAEGFVMPEVPAEGEVESLNASIGSLVTGIPWVWPALEALHFVGLGLMFGIVLLVNLRMLGVARSLSFQGLHRLLPWGVLGFSLNLITGMLFFIATPDQYTQNVAFHWKVVLMMAAVVNLLYLTLVDETWALGPDEDASWHSKLIAASTIAVWVGVIYLGRMLPYIGNSF